MFISDDQIQAAFDVLHSEAHAKSRAAYEYGDKRLKVVFAKAQLAASGKTVGERESLAMVSEEYQAALKQWHLICQTYFSERDKREAASAVIEAFRTQAADQRALGRVT